MYKCRIKYVADWWLITSECAAKLRHSWVLHNLRIGGVYLTSTTVIGQSKLLHSNELSLASNGSGSSMLHHLYKRLQPMEWITSDVIYNKECRTSGVSAGQIIPQWVLCNWRGLASFPSRPMGEFSLRRWESVEAKVRRLSTWETPALVWWAFRWSPQFPVAKEYLSPSVMVFVLMASSKLKSWKVTKEGSEFDFTICPSVGGASHSSFALVPGNKLESANQGVRNLSSFKF